jgi:FKBP-type peptidyl-prolyl cis-trans isomerase
MKKLFALSVILVLLAACKFRHNFPSPYKDFSTRDGITYYKYCDMGTSHRQPVKGDVAEVILSYAKTNDSVFWSSHEGGYPYSVFIPWSRLANGSTYERELCHANQGDSLEYIVPADSVFKNILNLPLPYFLHSGEMIKVHARILNILDSANYLAKIKAIKEYKKDMDLQEQLTLLRYVTANHIPDSMKFENVYVIPIERGNGPKVEKGTMLSLAYKGSFLAGHAFDSVSVTSPMQFKYGDTGQIISGLDRALKTMREGEKAKIIIPSQLAFGNNGSSTGIVPPYTTVVYEVTLLKVKALN